MTQEDKELLLKDLCARLPYGVNILHEGWNFEWDEELSTVEKVVGIDKDFIYTKVIDTHNGEEYRDDKLPIDTFDDKLFLRPMSSMTEEQKVIYGDLCYSVIQSLANNMQSELNELINWLNANHFDYRGLIPMGLAIDATNLNVY